MRKSIVLVLLTILFGTLLLTSCWTYAGSPDPILSTGYELLQGSEIVTKTGKIEILPDGSPALIEKWESKSRIFYTIVEDLSEQIVRRVGEIITVECIILTKDSPWQGEIVIISVHP